MLRLRAAFSVFCSTAILLIYCNYDGLAQSSGHVKRKRVQIVTIPFGTNGIIQYDLQKGSYQVAIGKDTVLYDAYAVYAGHDTVLSTENVSRRYSTSPLPGALQSGSLHIIEWERKGLRVQQLFYAYINKPYFLTQLKISGNDVASAYISPLSVKRLHITPRKLAADALVVPFDNDMWVRYDVQTIGRTNSLSSEVTALFNGLTGKGCVLGSVEHTVWKTGIRLTETGEINVFGGLADSVITHDKIPHGKVSINDTLIASPKIFVGFFEDCRKGMEEYAAENILAEPPAIKPWKKATPMGWNSWGMMQTKLTIEKAKQVVDYFHDSLKGFRNEDNTLYIDLDSYWDNLVKGGLNGDVSQLKEFATYCKRKGMVPGIYWAPFADWGKYDRPFENSNHRYGDAWIKQKGKPVDLDGALALDPTHPGTQARMALHINKFKELGFEMIKIDFLGHAALESDRFYDPKVTTGMQAYKVGMEYLSKLIDNKMLTYAAISPTMATGRYVHMRRIACDAFSAIDNTEYTLNSTGYGWWQSKLYDYVDADHVVFNKETPGVNRARLASALVTGTLITGDDFSVAGEWGKAAQSLLQNKKLLQLLKKGQPFWPMISNTGRKAPEVFIRYDDRTVYVAIFNYDKEPKSYPIDILPLPKRDSKPVSITELFSGEVFLAKPDMQVSVPGGDVKLFKFSTQ